MFFILSTYDTATRSLVKYLRQTGANLPDVLEFNTQVSWGHEGRPDLIGLNNNDRILLLESKFDAPLTKNQPIGYLKQLTPRMDGVLLFIAPSLRVEGLWEALMTHCANSKIALGTQRKSPALGLISAPVGSGHYLALASWDSLISYISDNLSHHQEQGALADLLQLKALCERLGSGNLQSFPLHQITSERDKRDRQLRTMIDSITKVLIVSGFAKTKGYRATPGPGYYKRYMTLSGYINWCVEYNGEYWARFGESLLWFSTTMTPENATALTILDISLAGLPHRFGNQFLIPLKASHCRSEEEALDHMTKQATAVATSLAIKAE